MAWRDSYCAYRSKSGLSGHDNLADISRIVNRGAMRLVRMSAVTLLLCLCGCSYSYDVVASVENGQVVFRSASQHSHAPDCLRRIEVYSIVERKTVWRDSVDYDDDCANEFPVTYGVRLKGKKQPEWPTIPAIRLQIGSEYEVSTTTGATGYGGGRFHLDKDGRVVNDPVGSP